VDGRRGQRAAAAGRTVGLTNGGRDFMARSDESPQCGDGKVSGAQQDYSHARFLTGPRQRGNEAMRDQGIEGSRDQEREGEAPRMGVGRWESGKVGR
jgi:hypothetical protein